MAKIDIISGFLGAGKTTLIQKLLKEALKGEKVVLIENEFGEIGIDGGFLKDAGIEVTEMNSGCICCSLVGDFGSALKEVVTQYNPDRIIIEPSGVGKLSDVIKAVQGVAEDVELDLNSFVTVADAKKCKMYMKNFGEFYNNQVEYAGSIILSRTGDVAEDKLNESVALLREHNEKAAIITTPWDELSGEQILKVMEDGNDMVKELLEEEEICLCAVDTMITNIITTMITNITITIMMKNATVDADMITTTTMIMNIIIITIMMKNAAVDVDMTMITTTIIMQMKYLQAGAKKHLRNIIRKNWIRSYRNYPKMTAMV